MMIVIVYFVSYYTILPVLHTIWITPSEPGDYYCPLQWEPSPRNISSHHEAFEFRVSLKHIVFALEVGVMKIRLPMRTILALLFLCSGCQVPARQPCRVPMRVCYRPVKTAPSAKRCCRSRWQARRLCEAFCLRESSRTLGPIFASWGSILRP